MPLDAGFSRSLAFDQTASPKVIASASTFTSSGSRLPIRRLAVGSLTSYAECSIGDGNSGEGHEERVQSKPFLLGEGGRYLRTSS